MLKTLLVLLLMQARVSAYRRCSNYPAVASMDRSRLLLFVLLLTMYPMTASLHLQDPQLDTNVTGRLVIIIPCLKKLCKLIFCQNFVKFRPIVKIFGLKIAKRTSFFEVYSISSSPNLQGESKKVDPL